jgi:hypothetical protein
MRTLNPLILVVTFGIACSATAATPPAEQLYPGMCEASAAVALDDGRFVVADDDEKDLRVYRLDAPSEPQILEISKLPGLAKKGDVEGAARIGDVFYWIGSHSRNNSGEERLERHRLFAITVETQGGKLVPKAVGTPYTKLLTHLEADHRFDKYGFQKASTLASEAPGALNIEGLAATPAGGLLLGFRNPVPGGKALLVPLHNPRDVLDSKSPSFGNPMELDLGGRGIRSLEYWPAGKMYVISAGSPDSAGSFQLYLWSGSPQDEAKPVAGTQLSGLIPEAAFFASPSSAELIVLSDDGDHCPPVKAFRSRRLSLQTAAPGKASRR